jgi:AraC family transcriptional regulator
VNFVSMTQIKVTPGHPVPLGHVREAVSRAVALLEAADRELGQTQDAARASIARATSILLAEIRRPAQTRSDSSDVFLLPWQARRVADYIEENIAQPIGICDLCALLHRSKAYFSRAFKGTFGVPPHAYMLRRRIELASRLMIESTTPLIEIALKCGFSDQAHFTRRFRQLTGATPAAWRRERVIPRSFS